MYVRDLIASLLRRWYLLALGLVLTAGLAFAAFSTVSPTYEAKGSVLLLPPASSVGQRGNPYLYLGGLAQAVEVLSARMNATETIQPIQDAHPDAVITIGQNAESTGPIILVTVDASSAESATGTVQDVLNALPTTLVGMQNQLTVPDSSRITSIRLTNDITVKELTKTRDRAVIAIAGVGVAGTVLLVGLIDGLLLGRIPRLRRAPAPAAGWEVPRSDPPDTTVAAVQVEPVVVAVDDAAVPSAVETNGHTPVGRRAAPSTNGGHPAESDGHEQTDDALPSPVEVGSRHDADR